MTTPYYSDDLVTLWHGDCRDVLATLPDASVDAVVTDPPYELGFMGKAWDASGIAYSVPMWSEVFRVLKPGGHLLSFGGTRTWHRMVCAVEDAGFEVRDCLGWLYGSGFPKSLDVSKAIDKAAGAERVVVGTKKKLDSYGDTVNEVYGSGPDHGGMMTITAPATPDAERWQGWGTALKPAWEPICVARKPLIGNVAANVLEHGTGALNIDATRVGTEGGTKAGERQRKEDGRLTRWDEGSRGARNTIETLNAGRWPANVVLDEDAATALDAQSGESVSNRAPRGGTAFAAGVQGGPRTDGHIPAGHSDSGGASRFFYVAKAPTHERPKVDGKAHATVKPLTLMRWLVRLVTPPGGTVLDPFAGSGTTAEACVIEGFHCQAIEADADHLPLIVQRLTKPIAPSLFGAIQ